MRNRISAQLSRDRKKLEKDDMQTRLAHAEALANSLEEENRVLKERLLRNEELEEQLSVLKKRFEQLESLLLQGSTQTREVRIGDLASDADVSNSGIRSETHATGMHSLLHSSSLIQSASALPAASPPLLFHPCRNLSSHSRRATTAHATKTTQASLHCRPVLTPSLPSTRRFCYLLPHRHKMADKSKTSLILTSPAKTVRRRS